MSISIAYQEDFAEPPQVGSAMMKLLAHRYGDGLVYLRGQEERDLYQKAKLLGYINNEGYLTPAGRTVLTGNDD
jgi:hypothetical protein